MAGSLAVVVGEQFEKSVTAIRGQWEIQYARFFHNPSISSTCATLAPCPKTRHLNGTWLSSAPSAATLRLLIDHSRSKAIFTISVGEKIQEEHFLYKLHFSWPQLSCVPGFPARGCRVIFVSFRNSSSLQPFSTLLQIQKFAMRFSTICVAQTFINALKETLSDERDIELPSTCSGCRSEVSAPSEITPYRAKELDLITPVEDCYQVSLSKDLEVTQHSFSQETFLNPNSGSVMALPPSFTSLMSSCCSDAKQAQTTLSPEVDFKAQIMKFMEDSSFLDMLNKVEKVIGELGDGLVP